MKWKLGITLVVVLLVLMSVDWRGERGSTLDVLGSTSVQPFAEMLAEEFNAHPPDAGDSKDRFTVDVQGGGSTAGLQAAANGVADIGMCSRSLKKEEAAIFTPVTVARDGLAIVVHRSNPVSNLTREQIQHLFAGEIHNWKQVGGDDRVVRLITREEGSGTREAFTKMVMGKSRISRKALTQESNGSVKELVKDDPAAIGYMSLGLVGSELKAIRVDGVEPTHEQVIAARYPLVRPFLFVTNGPPEARARRFIEYVLSDQAQALLEKEGLVRAQ